MLDLETMGNCPNAAICTIGAVEFDLDNHQIGEKFYCPVNLASAVEQGGVIDTATILWWLKQSEEARSSITGRGNDMTTALFLFTSWLDSRGERKDIKIWGNGAGFDNVILASAYRRLHLPIPWDYWNNRCYRTIKAFRPEVTMERIGTHHNAVDDAESQARHLLAIFQSSR